MKHFSLITFLFLVACAPVTRQAMIDPGLSESEKRIQQEMALEQQLKNRVRVATVGERIAQAAAAYCEDKVAPAMGIISTSEKQLGTEFRPAAQKLWSVEAHQTVIAVIPQSAAELAGIKVGDQIIEVNDKALPQDAFVWTDFISKPYDGVNSNTLLIKREGQEHRIQIKPLASCGYPTMVVSDDTVNAYADGDKIMITTGMLRFAQTDEELATVIGHELAHNQMGHLKKQSGNRLIGAIIGAVVTVATGVDVTNTFAEVGGGAYSQDFESEADYVGIYHTARAGYDIRNSPNFWRRMGIEHPKAIAHGTSHPSTANRFVALDNAVKEIDEKKLAGLELVPNAR